MHSGSQKRWIILKVILFFALLIGLLLLLNQVLKRKDVVKPWDITNKIVGFTNEPQNSIDLMYFGSSHSFCSFIPDVIDEKCGTNSYIYATQQQPFWITYHYMLEALKYQSLETMVLEVYGSTYTESYAEEATNRSAFDGLFMSQNQTDLIKASLNPKEDSYFEYYVPFVKYHSRWNKLSASDFYMSYYNETDPLSGYVKLEKIESGEQADLMNITECTPLLPKSEEYLKKIIELAKSKGIKLVLVGAPCNLPVDMKKQFNSVEKIAGENDIPFIDYNLRYEETGIENEKHFYDGGHLNYEGANLFSTAFADFLKALG